jgi:3-phenylpropionate/cinnamic acid dioxygenase small subunit
MLEKFRELASVVLGLKSKHDQLAARVAELETERAAMIEEIETLKRQISEIFDPSGNG